MRFAHLFLGVFLLCTFGCHQQKKTLPMEVLDLDSAWDKTFEQSSEVNHQKVCFVNRFGITLAADLYLPKNASSPLSAIAISGPFGAVKEQCAGWYAQTLAERGFATLAFDPSFTGESGGQPRHIASPDINTEDFCAAVDFLSTLEHVDPHRIGILGIDGWGTLALNASALDTRIKATVAISIEDLSPRTDRAQLKETLNAQRLADLACGEYQYAGGVIDPLPDDAPQAIRETHAYYRTSRGYHERSLNSNGGWVRTSALSFINTPLLSYCHEIQSAVLLVQGENAHTRDFSEDTFKRLKGNNKQLVRVSGATHYDLYDNPRVVPFDTLTGFFLTYLR